MRRIIFCVALACIVGVVVWLYRDSQRHNGVNMSPRSDGDVPSTRGTVNPRRPIKLADFPVKAGLSRSDVEAAVGRPDAEMGYGILWCVYPLEDGRQVWVRYDQDGRLIAADLVEHRGGAEQRRMRLAPQQQ